METQVLPRERADSGSTLLTAQDVELLLVAASAPAPAKVEALVEAIARALRTDVALVRMVDHASATASARALACSSAALRAELEGSELPAADLPEHEVDRIADLAPAARGVAQRAGAEVVLQLPLAVDGRIVGSLELLRARPGFTPRELAIARLAATFLSLAAAAENPSDDAREAGTSIGIVGEALDIGLVEGLAHERLLRLAIEATGAVGAMLWAIEDNSVSPAASLELPDALREPAAVAASAILGGREPVEISLDAGGNATADGLATIRLGEPPAGVLQLVFPSERRLGPVAVTELARLGAKIGGALRAGEHSRELAAELQRLQALLAVVNQAIARLSVSHTLETAVERVAELLGTERLAVYLVGPERLTAAAERGLAGPHEAVAERLLELALGPFRPRGVLLVEDAAVDPRLGPVREAAAEAGLESAVAVPLVVHDEVIGLLAAYPPRSRKLTPNEVALLSALAIQLAVALQNARLHEEAEARSAALTQALGSEQQASQQVRALYEISRSFTVHLSLDATLEAVARTAVELVGVDAAVVRMLNERANALETRAIHIPDGTLAPSLRALLSAPQPISAPAAHLLLAERKPLVLDTASAGRAGPPYDLLVPFLRQGATGVIVPIATPGEVLATLTLVSVDGTRAVTSERVDTAFALARQAALAIDNARLYQQQEHFLETMQRSLLPERAPEAPGLDIGHVYESSARLEFGGDVYDFMLLEDGRLAAVLGDVIGHGIDAAAEMAMAKFVFRSLAREHSDPGEFLASANDVVSEETGPSSFITMVYLTIDAVDGWVFCASAGHPLPRLVLPDGRVVAAGATGVALGIEPGLRYEENGHLLPRGGAVVLYTDGVIEAKREGELYGEERLDRLLSTGRQLPAKELAESVLADCREWSGGELRDDCAVVVVKRL